MRIARFLGNYSLALVREWVFWILTISGLLAFIVKLIGGEIPSFIYVWLPIAGLFLAMIRIAYKQWAPGLQMSVRFYLGNQVLKSIDIPPFRGPKVLVEDGSEDNPPDKTISIPLPEITRQAINRAYEVLEPLQPTEEQMESYKKELAKYQVQKVEFLKFDQNYSSFRIVVLNNGSAPANNVSIDLDFPDGFALSEERQKLPEKPKPPKAGLDFDAIVKNMPTLHSKPTPVSEPYYQGPWVKGQSVQFWIKKVQQNEPEIHPFPLYVLPPTQEGTYKVRFRMNADELPRPFRGNLIARVTADANRVLVDQESPPGRT